MSQATALHARPASDDGTSTSSWVEACAAALGWRRQGWLPRPANLVPPQRGGLWKERCLLFQTLLPASAELMAMPIIHLPVDSFFCSSIFSALPSRQWTRSPAIARRWTLAVAWNRAAWAVNPPRHSSPKGSACRRHGPHCFSAPRLSSAAFSFCRPPKRPSPGTGLPYTRLPSSDGIDGLKASG